MPRLPPPRNCATFPAPLTNHSANRGHRHEHRHFRRHSRPPPPQKRSLDRAKAAKRDEFYTQLSDIEKELENYEQHFRGKTVLCNCDDPRVSNFFHYFSHQFEELGIKKLVTTCYKSQVRDMFSRHDSEQAISLEYTGDRNQNRIPDPDEIGIKPLQGDGDFRSEECMALLRQADIVVTNPPFSLFREYVAQLVEYEKKFLILGSMNAISYKEIFPLMRNNQIWLGVNNKAKKFVLPDHAEKYHSVEDGTKFMHMGNVVWFTNLDHPQHHEELLLYKAYNPDEYPKYDNYDAINVNDVKSIPADYAGVMGVPVSFLDKHNPDQFEILGLLASAGYNEDIVGIPILGQGDARGIVSGVVKFARLLIKHKRVES